MTDVENKLIQGFSFGFTINSVIKKTDKKFPNNHRSVRENPEVSSSRKHAICMRWKFWDFSGFV